MSSLPVAGRLTVVEEVDRFVVAPEDDPSDWLCAFAKTGDFPAARWAHDMARTYNARLELSSASNRRPRRGRRPPLRRGA